MPVHQVLSLVRVATFLTVAFAPGLDRPAPVATLEDPGIIAYVRHSTHDIHVVSPDGTGDRVLRTAPQPPALMPAHGLAWRPDGCELAIPS